MLIMQSMGVSVGTLGSLSMLTAREAEAQLISIV